ncbi:terminase [Mycolicibacterium sp. S2-37]|uniref:terminase n=1 Tax=Mycolicibacterium sp. S2-37 TaxID=2810297 RepID=UPI001A9477C9|nr:terminase [Mycolicibacterium sp. S2-37]MBO0676802.1 terminase [Mycolicibacterium sp. S2-37]
MTTPVIKGSETPRIFTPPLRELTPETTHGFAAILFAKEMLGITLFPWQEWLLKHALELNEDGTYRFRYLIVLVARQNGKSLVLLVLALWHLFALGSKQVIATAQDLGRSEAAWKEAVEWIEEDEELAALIFNVDRGHPKLIEIGGEELDEDMPWLRRYRVASAGRRGARGFSGDLVLMDELREHQNWDTWSAIVNTMNARPDGQAWAFSNAGDLLSIVLRTIRAQNHQRLGWPDGDADSELLAEIDPEMEAMLEEAGAADMTGFFEWSANPRSKRNDLEQLALANPSMNHNDIVPQCITSSALLAGLASGVPMTEFDTEVRCVWVAGAGAGPFPEGAWADTFDDEAKPGEGAKKVVCVAVNQSRTISYIAKAALDENGFPIVGIIADELGTDWVTQWLIDNKDTYETIVVQDKGAPVSSLVPEFEDAKLNLTLWPATDVAPATGLMFDLVVTKELRHLTHPGLDAAAATAAVKILSRAAFEIDMVKSPTDAAPLQAAIGAVWALETVRQADPEICEWPSDDEIRQWLEEEDDDDWLT